MPRIRDHRLGEPFSCQLLATGQTTQYNGKEDDGYWEKGKAKKYVVLSAGQYSGSVNIVLNSKTHVLSNNCVFDKKTGLMWARYAPDADIGPGNDGKLLWVDDVNNEDIFDFKDQANVKELGGYGDWRVPNKFELMSLVDHSVFNPTIDTSAFPSTSNYQYWTSTTRADASSSANYVHFGVGDQSTQTKATHTCFCRLVRGPK